MVVTRFAPSPTGFLHLGGARTAYFNYAWAKHNNGRFILRIEDTDAQRSTQQSVDGILESLRWLGLDWDDGPYFQTQRLGLYNEAMLDLWRKGAVYPAFETKEELDQARAEAEAAGREYVYTGASRSLSREEAQRRLDAGDPFAWRFRTPTDGYVEVPETLRGDNDVRFACTEIGDFLINRIGTLENPGMPLYNFVCAYDDAVMGITNVIRGEEHLTNAPKQILMIRAMGYEIPQYTHLPLVLKNNKKMSKRDAEADPRFPVSVAGRRELGYMRHALLNYIGLLGWSFPNDREFARPEDFIAAFDLGRLIKSAANFDEDKFLHFNGWYVRNSPLHELLDEADPFIRAAGIDLGVYTPGQQQRMVELVRERIKLLTEIPASLAYFFSEPSDYDPKGVKKIFGEEGVQDLLLKSAELLALVDEWNAASIEAPLRAHAEATGLGIGKIAQPLRLAVTGRTASPGLFDVLELLGRDITIARVRRAAEAIPSLLAQATTEPAN